MNSRQVWYINLSQTFAPTLIIDDYIEQQEVFVTAHVAAGL